MFDPKIYRKLVADALPGVIETVEENDRALEILDRLMSKGEGNNSPEEVRLIKTLGLLVSEYEKEAYSEIGATATPASILRSLMEEHKLIQNDLIDIFSSQGSLSQVLNGKREISKIQAKKLAERFGLSVAAFI